MCPGTVYPLSVDDERAFADGYDGNVYVWDIDKTYLLTGFSSLKGLTRVPLELAVDKRAVPGMPEVLRGLRRGSGRRFDCTPLYFVSASPPQLRPVIERKMTIDGVEYDGITFKDWVGVMRSLRPGRLLEQVGFKLCALLTGRLKWPLACEYLFGDDAERDAEAFHLYERLVVRELVGAAAERAMRRAGVSAEDRRCVQALLEQLPLRAGSVGRIFIHLQKRTSPARFGWLGSQVIPVRGACQLAMALFELGLVAPHTVELTCEAVCSADRSVDLQALTADAVARHVIDQERLASLRFLRAA